MMTRRPWAVAAIATVALLAGACAGTTGSGSSPAGSGTNTGGGPRGNAGLKVDCGSVPASVVNAALGIPVGEPNQTVNSVVTLCQYASTSGSETVLVRFQTNEDAAGFARAKAGFTDSGQPTTDIAGFFDQAFSSSLGSGDLAVNTVVARKGSVEILVTSPAPVDKEKELITKIFAAIG